MVGESAAGSPELRAALARRGLPTSGAPTAGSPELRAAVAKVAHHAPGRLRLRFEREANVQEAAERIRAVLIDRPGVKSVEVHPRSKSVVVNYTPAELELQRLIDEGLPAAAVDLLGSGLEVVAAVASGTAVGRGIVRTVSGANNRLEEATGGVLDLRDVFPLTLFGLGIGRLIQSGLQPVPWHNLLYYGYSTFVALHGRRGGHAQAGPDAVELLRRRFCQGEITRAEYREMLAELSAPGVGQRAEIGEGPREAPGGGSKEGSAAPKPASRQPRRRREQAAE